MNDVTVRGMPRGACAMAMTYFHLNELKKHGLMTGGIFELSDEGIVACSELAAAGFAFNPGELEDCARALMGGVEQRVSQ